MTRRLVLSYVLLAAFVLAVVELPLGLTYAARAQDRLLNDIERDARVLAGLVQPSVAADRPEAVTEIADRYASESSARVVITDEAGTSIVDTGRRDDPPRDFSTRPEIDEALSGFQATGFRSSTTLGRELAYVAVPISTGGTLLGAVRVTLPTDEVSRQIRDQRLRLALLSALILAGAASLGWIVARWATGPLQQLESGARRLAEGDLSGRADVRHGPAEMRHLAATFDEMASRLELLVHSQQSFVADASHQLRTPLTALRLRIESLEASLDDYSDVDGVDTGRARSDLQAIDTELERLGGLVAGLLALARNESATASVVVDAAAVAREAVDRWAALAQEHGLGLTLDEPDEARVRTVAGGLDQILDNLLDNALGVAPPGTDVDVRVHGDEQRVIVSVRDRGPGMPADERARATDRFWRSADAPPGGTGLGLAIAAELATVAGGSVALDDPDDGAGLLVTVTLPRVA